MIVALFLKSYKIYKNIKFIPLAKNSNFSALIGPNGTGKSSVLEALDSYFNLRDWNINKQTKSAGGTVYINTPYVAPIFVVRKSTIGTQSQSNRDTLELLENLSEYFWKIERKDVVSSSSETSDFLRFRDELKEVYSMEDYLLFIAGKRYEQQDKIYFGPFHHQDSFLAYNGYTASSANLDKDSQYAEEDEFLQSHFSRLISFVQKQYVYVYIPSDIDVADYTKLEADDMQKLMDRNIKDIIQESIKQKSLNDINQSLNLFIDEITAKLNGYTYRKPIGGKANLTMPDLVATIIREFFSIRFLTKQVSGELIPVSNLSSGEKRKSLIDLAYAFLISSKRREMVIVGIDEPEISLHVSACFDQFEKLASLAEDGNQIMITTHWYGFLPAAQEGLAIFMNTEDEKVVSEHFELGTYREQIVKESRKNQGKMPYDVFLKSTYDLVQSIVLSVRNPNSYKWILCEGTSERIYFSHIFAEEINARLLRILPLGGCGEVVRLYKILEVAFGDKELDLSGSVLAIVDTDEKLLKFSKSLNHKRLMFRRLYYKDSDVKLIEVDSVDVSNVTEIEQTLRSDLYLKVLAETGTEEVKELVASETPTATSVWSYDSLDLKPSQAKLIQTFFDSPDGNKTKFASAYVNHADFDPEKEPIRKQVLDLLK